jgi:hypothetical protein
MGCDLALTPPELNIALVKVVKTPRKLRPYTVISGQHRGACKIYASIPVE